MQDLIRDLLRDELTTRCKKNPKYSLRAFSKFLEVSPATLSGILNGKRSVTDRAKKVFFQKLNLSKKEVNKLKDRKLLRDDQFKKIYSDEFSYISQWYHYAILELLCLKDFSFTVREIAKTLGIHLYEVKSALKCMQELGLISKVDGVWRDLSGGRTTHIDIKNQNEAAKNHQKQLVEKSLYAIEHVQKNERDHTSLTMAIDSSDIEKAKKIIKEFRRKLGKELSASKKANSVYQLQVSFFPLTRGTD